MTITFRPGKLPAQPGRPHLKASAVLAEHRSAAAAPPPASCLFADPAITWDMYGNDQWGDCEEAGYGHWVNQATFYGSGAEAKPTTADVLGMYSAITGFNPKKPNTDQGTYTQDLLAYARKTGLAGHKLVAYAAVDVANVTEMKQAVFLFGQLFVGIQFPGSAMDQFNAGQDWDVVKGATVEGGHCVLVVGYDETGLWLVTWGKLIRMTWAFWAKYGDEGWLGLDQDGVQKAGTYFTGLSSFWALGAQFAALTGEANPIPAPAPQPTPPAPVPTPAPTPTPVPADADHALAASMHSWLTAKGL